MRILLLAEVNPRIPFDYKSGFKWNAGNNVFATAISYYFSCRGGVFFTFADVAKLLQEDLDWGKKNFDAAVVAEACIFADEYTDLMLYKTHIYKRLGIPIYVLGAGVQAHFGTNVRLVESIQDAARHYLDAVYGSGGFLTVRGEYSHDVCEKLGYKCVITGCTSLFVGGQDFLISNNKVARDTFRVALNGADVDEISSKIYDKYPKCVFFDQDLYQNLLYHPLSIENDELKSIISQRLIALYELSINDSPQLVLYQDFSDWLYILRQRKFTFSYGSRMHGNVMALISGIPCFIKVHDLRVQEMVDYYSIPNSSVIKFDERKENLYDLYLSLDWTEFNDKYKLNYSHFIRLIDKIAPLTTIDTNALSMSDFIVSKSFAFSDITLKRMRHMLHKCQIRRFHFLIFDWLTFGFIHSQMKQKYGKYFC